MALITANDVFPYLVGGIAEASKTHFRYPYPPLFQQALNKFSVLQLLHGKTLSPELKDLLTLFEEPIDTWWPGALPQEVERQMGKVFTLMYDGQPDGWVWRYLRERGAKLLAPESLQYFQADIDQSAIIEVMNFCRAVNPPRTDIYIAVRRFLIEHPWTTLSDLQQSLGSFPQIPMQLLNSFYETPDVFRRYALRNGSYWLCPHCDGILSWEEQEPLPQCARHSVCGRLFPGYQGMQPCAERIDLLRLKWGIHRRVCIPGIPELKLFRWLETKKTLRCGLDDVLLWPGVDQYDLQLLFAGGEVWAVDVKDYENPSELFHKIHQDTLPKLGTLDWKRGLYVVPQYRIAWNKRYIQQVHQAANRQKGKPLLPAGIEIVSEERFRERVLEQIQKCSSFTTP